MNHSNPALALTCACAILLISSCATPKPVKELASRGAATTGLAEASLRDYLAASSAQLDGRMELLRTNVQRLEQERVLREFEATLDRRAGVTNDNSAVELIQALAGDVRSFREDEKKRLDKIASDLSFDLAALPKAPSDKIAAAKKSFAVLAEELSASEWITLIGGYAKAIKEGLEKLDK